MTTNEDLIRKVADSFSIGPVIMAGFEDENGLLPEQHSLMRTVYDIILEPQSSNNPFHNLLINFNGLTIGELKDYLDESGISYRTNEITDECVKALNL